MAAGAGSDRAGATRCSPGYCTGEYGIFLKPVALFDAEPGASALAQAVAAEGETIWTRPR